MEDKTRAKSKVHKKVWIVIIISIIIGLLLISGIYISLSISKEKSNSQIPNLSGYTLEEAMEIVKELDLEIEVEKEIYNPEIEKGKIIAQKPEYKNNSKIKKGSTIKVIVSTGENAIKVPKVIGYTRNEAIKMLEDLGLEVEIQEDYSNVVEKGYVMSQSIEEGEIVSANNKIIIYISKGIEQVQVPDLSGKTESEAKSSITNAKLKWKSTEKTFNSSKPSGVVINQSIPSGSMVDRNTEITITLNSNI